MQAITTKFLGPTNFRGSRIKARCEAGTLLVSWNHALDSEANHKGAALALVKKLGWKGRWVGGGLPDTTGYAFVCVR